jgi:predicted RNA-binding Zn-ribbon protein involved in translation (DUF1610 family)
MAKAMKQLKFMFTAVPLCHTCEIMLDPVKSKVLLLNQDTQQKDIVAFKCPKCGEQHDHDEVMALSAQVELKLRAMIVKSNQEKKEDPAPEKEAQN